MYFASLLFIFTILYIIVLYYIFFINNLTKILSKQYSDSHHSFLHNFNRNLFLYPYTGNLHTIKHTIVPCHLLKQPLTIQKNYSNQIISNESAVRKYPPGKHQRFVMPARSTQAGISQVFAVLQGGDPKSDYNQWIPVYASFPVF